ncbi:MAG: hypothetical protein QOE31_968, partial [Solirubrobacteraceae bacterium]|nr:hypothetical protein [Solirubrobacteraceae bacterium]
MSAAATPASAPARVAGAAAALVSRTSPRRVLLVGTALLLGLRLAISLARSGPVIMADEAGYLLNARILAGGMPGEMGSSPFYRGGYSLLVAPILSLGGDPVLSYHAVLALNAVLAASLVPLLYVLLTRCFDVAPPAAAWSALAGAAYPSVTALSQVALSENALFALTAAWLLVVGLLLRAPTAGHALRWSAAAGLCAAALWTVHGRMVVAVVLTALVLVVAAAQRRIGRAAAAAGLAVLAGGMLAGRLLNDWLIATNYDGRAIDELRGALTPLRHVDGILAVLRNLVGQGWYLLTATLGVVVLLVAGVAPRALARLRARRGEPGDLVLVVLLATTAGLLAVSSLWFATVTRADQLVYGRYVEPVVPALLAVGLALAGRARLRAGALVAGLAGLTVAVAALRLGLDVPGEPSRWNVAALPSVTGSIGAPVIAVAGVVACAALWLFALVARRRPAALAPLALVLFAPTTAYVVYLPVLRSEHDVYPAGWTSPRPVAEE